MTPPNKKQPEGDEFSDLPQVREVTNEMLAERIDGLRSMMKQANADREQHVAEDRLAHAEFRLAIAALSTQATVSRTEFKPVQMLVYSMVGTILLGVLGALITLVVRSNGSHP